MIWHKIKESPPWKITKISMKYWYKIIILLLPKKAFLHPTLCVGLITYPLSNYIVD